MGENFTQPDSPQGGDFGLLLTNAQPGLLRYITTLVGDREAANTILQETNLLLWRKIDEFEVGTNFEAWATRTAYWQVKAFSRDRGRDRHVFGELLVDQLADRTDHRDDFDQTKQLLQTCMKKLRTVDREMLDMKYHQELTMEQMSGITGKTIAAIKGSLLRIRRNLRICIESKRNTEE